MKNWLVTAGKATIADDKIIYIPEKGKTPDGKEMTYTAVVNSNIDFENGTIKFSVLTDYNLSIAQVSLSTEKGDLNIGMNTMGYLFGMTRYDKDNQRWENPEGAGYYENYIVKEKYNFKVEVNGSVITLFVNDIKITDAIYEVKKGQIKFYMQGESEIVISDIEVITKKPKAFVVMQFTEEYNQLYTEVIHPVCEKFGLEVERADEFYTTTPIIADVIRSIVNSSLVIAEITPDNANVYYEVGYAHAINKPTILLCERKKREKLPFDISGFRTLFYEDSISGKSTIEKNLRKFLENIIM